MQSGMDEEFQNQNYFSDIHHFKKHLFKVPASNQ
jgi:hypothetical protein